MTEAPIPTSEQDAGRRPPVDCMTAGAMPLACGLWAAIVTHVVLASVIGIQVPGLQFDEAILQHGGLHLLKSKETPPCAYNRGTWIQVGDRHLP